MCTALKPPAQPVVLWKAMAAKPAKPPNGLKMLQAYKNTQFAAVGAMCA
jgi:hypothetical protein